jgi:hypothetical protein
MNSKRVLQSILPSMIVWLTPWTASPTEAGFHQGAPFSYSSPERRSRRNAPNSKVLPRRVSKPSSDLIRPCRPTDNGIPEAEFCVTAL